MPRPMTIAFYDKDFQRVEIHPTRAAANRSNAQYAHEKVFYYVHPDQVRVLGYAQAVDLETILHFATTNDTQNKGNRIATI